jgi:hypothetical protein
MRRGLIVVGVLIAAVGLVWIAGSFLPREHRAASRITLRQPIDSVWAVVRNLGALKGTWSELTSADQLPPDAQGRERWQETVDGFEIRLAVVEATPPTRLVTEVETSPGDAFGGRWIYELVQNGTGTAVIVAEEGWIGPPPFRIMSRLMGYHQSIDQYLQALGRHFGESAVPQHVP